MWYCFEESKRKALVLIGAFHGEDEVYAQYLCWREGFSRAYYKHSIDLARIEKCAIKSALAKLRKRKNDAASTIRPV